MHRSSLYLLMGIIWSLAFNNDIIAQITSPSEEKIDEIFSYWPKEGPGGVVGIVHNGELVFQKAYGKASLEYNIPMTNETVLNIASVSKQITAYSLILLEQQGKLSLDDDVRKYLPEIPDFGTPITIRHLLTHTSGLRNFQNLLAIAGWREGDAMTNDDLLRYISRQKELNFPVGEEYLYCNSGFVLVTFIVERVTGEDFKDWTRKNIFEPLGMMNTSYRENMERIHPNTATSYRFDQSNQFVQPLKYWTYMGNGNVYTTVEDLSKWIANFETGQLGGMKAINILIEPGILNNGDTLGYALGIGIGDYRGIKRYSHGGSVGGYRSNMVYYPEENLGVIVLTNFSTANPGRIVSAISDYLMESKLEETATASSNQPGHLSEEKEISAEAWSVLKGEYLVDGVLVKIFDCGEKVCGIAEGVTPQFEIKAASDTSFFVQGFPLSFWISKNQEMDIQQFDVLQGFNRSRGYKIEKTFMESEKSHNLIGKYFSPELNTFYHIEKENQKFLAKHPRHSDTELTAHSRERWSSASFHLSQLKFKWNGTEVEGFWVSNGRVRNLWFEKLE